MNIELITLAARIELIDAFNDDPTMPFSNYDIIDMTLDELIDDFDRFTLIFNLADAPDDAILEAHSTMRDLIAANRDSLRADLTRLIAALRP